MPDSVILSCLATLWGRLQQLSFTQQLALPLLIASISWMLYNYLFRLRGVPGPFIVRLGIPGSLALWALQLKWIWKVQSLHDKYGPVVRIAPNQIDLISAEAVQKIYSHGSPYLKPKSFYDGFVVVEGRPSIFSDTDPASHAHRRKGVAAAYALNYLIKLEECIDPLIDQLVVTMAKQLRPVSGKTWDATFDVTKVAHLFAMDAVGELAFGQSFGLLASLSDPLRFLRGVSNLSQWGGAFAYMPGRLGRWLRPVIKSVLREPGGEVVVPATRERIAKRYRLLAQETEPPRPDMLTKFIEGIEGSRAAVHTKEQPTRPSTKQEQPTPSPPPTKQEQVLFTSTSVIAAGSDTTSLAIATTLRYVVGNPQCYRKVQAEVDEAFESGRLKEPCAYAAGVKLEYLQACIKEALRLHPPISMSLPRVVPAGGDVIDGRFYAAGTIVGVAPFLLHRDTGIWGADAADFKPERWLDSGKPGDQERLKWQSRNFLSFGGGSRQCIGKNISMMEITKTLPRLFWHFSFRLPPIGDASGTYTRRLSPRGSDGSESIHEPWHVSSSWFLNAEELFMRVEARRPEELEDLLD